MKLYHTTTPWCCDCILTHGFDDKTGNYGFPIEMTGVWFADRPLGFGEGAKGDPAMGDPVFVIDLGEVAIAPYELVGSSTTYREWCIPAALVNTCRRTVIYDPMDDSQGEEWWKAVQHA